MEAQPQDPFVFFGITTIILSGNLILFSSMYCASGLPNPICDETTFNKFVFWLLMVALMGVLTAFLRITICNDEEGEEVEQGRMRRYPVYGSTLVFEV